MFDVAIIGGGPAGLSAAIQARQRNLDTLLIDQRGQTGMLALAEQINNYPGLPGLTGLELLEKMLGHAKEMRADCKEGLVRQILPMGEGFALSAENDFYEARAIILATGAKQPNLLPGEGELLGRGVSHCPTCDGMLYRGKVVALLGKSAHAPHEANFLAELADKVLYFGKDVPALSDKVVRAGKKIERILGDTHVTGIVADGKEIPVDGVFILRDSFKLDLLLPGLKQRDGFIKVNDKMETSIPHVFAVGDCVGHPLQVAKAVGQGCIAALSVAELLQ